MSVNGDMPNGAPASSPETDYFKTNPKPIGLDGHSRVAKAFISQHSE